MANVNIKFNGKEFLLSCEDGQEEHLEELSIHLNNKFNDLKNSLGNIGENKLLLIASIKVYSAFGKTFFFTSKDHLPLLAPISKIFFGSNPKDCNFFRASINIILTYKFPFVWQLMEDIYGHHNILLDNLNNKNTHSYLFFHYFL